MSWAFNNIQFTEFQKAVLNRTVGKDGKKFILPLEANAESLIIMERPREEKEVQMNMRFLSKSSHAPIVHFNLYQYTPNPESTKRKCNTLTTAGKSTDSVLHGVFTALDYEQGNPRQINH